jgi:hypothetical protein
MTISRREADCKGPPPRVPSLSRPVWKKAARRRKLRARNQNRRTIPSMRPGLLFLLLLAATAALAHHSAPVFYRVQERVTVSGTVTEFRFTNPHAILKFEVVGEDGATQQWTAETTSPSILRRRGWSQQSFVPGEKVTLEGMPSVDGSYLIRITRAFREDGTEIGLPPGTDN